MPPANVKKIKGKVRKTREQVQAKTMACVNDLHNGGFHNLKVEFTEMKSGRNSEDVDYWGIIYIDREELHSEDLAKLAHICDMANANLSLRMEHMPGGFRVPRLAVWPQ